MNVPLRHSRQAIAPSSHPRSSISSVVLVRESKYNADESTHVYAALAKIYPELGQCLCPTSLETSSPPFRVLSLSRLFKIGQFQPQGAYNTKVLEHRKVLTAVSRRSQRGGNDPQNKGRIKVQRVIVCIRGYERLEAKVGDSIALNCCYSWNRAC